MKRLAHFLVLLALLMPMLASAQLPMLLDRGAPQLIGVPPDQSLLAYAGVTAYFYGDSVTVGYNPNFPPDGYTTNRFSTLLSAQFSMIEDNEGVGGSEIADAQADAITQNNSISNSTVSVWLAGYNDVFWFGTNADALTDNLAAVESLAAWLAIPTAFRVPCTYTADYGPNNSSIYYGPGWKFNDLLGGLAFSTQPTYASFYFSGNTLLIGTALASSSAGSVTVTVGDDVDGNIMPTYATNTYSCVRTSGNTGPGAPDTTWGNRDYSPGLIVITNLTSNRHYAFFTPQGYGNTFLGWYASYSTNQLPKVILAGTLNPAGTNYSNPDAPYPNGSGLAALEYSQMLSNAAVTLSALQLNVRWLPAPALDSNTDYYFDGIHPDDSGHLKLKNALDAGF